jgi:hypothetical protein
MVCRNFYIGARPRRPCDGPPPQMQGAIKGFRRFKAKSICRLFALLLQSKANSRLPTTRLFKSPRLRKFQCATTASRISTDSGTFPMQVLIDHTAQALIDQLSTKEQIFVQKALKDLSEVQDEEGALSRIPRVKRLSTILQRLAGLTNSDLYVYSAGDELRLLFSVHQQKIIVLDLSSRRNFSDF